MYSAFLSSYTNTRESLGELEKAFYHDCHQSRNLIGSFAVVDKSTDRAAHVNVSRNAIFSSRSTSPLLKKKTFFDVESVVKNKSNVV